MRHLPHTAVAAAFFRQKGLPAHERLGLVDYMSVLNVDSASMAHTNVVSDLLWTFVRQMVCETD